MTLPEISVAIDGGLELDRAGLAALIASLPGSIGWMTVVNFMLDSDFKWLLLHSTFLGWRR